MLNRTTHRLLLHFNTKDMWTFAELCRQANYSPDLGSYYIKQLVKGGYIERTERGVYTITLKGSVQLNRTKAIQLEVWRPRMVLVIVLRIKVICQLFYAENAAVYS